MLPITDDFPWMTIVFGGAGVAIIGAVLGCAVLIVIDRCFGPQDD